MKNKKTLLKASTITFVSILLITIISIFPNQTYTILSKIQKLENQFASIILSHNFRTVDEIKSHYNNPKSKVRILIVPGHEPTFGGTEYSNIKERDMNVELGESLQKLLQNDKNYQVFISRDKEKFNPIFNSYFEKNWNEIKEWRNASQEEFSNLVAVGTKIKTYSTVGHNLAPNNVAIRLYGITKWANENKMDIVIHIHFNDNRRANTNKPGIYSGFSMYVPANQYGNSTTTKTIAKDILNYLSKYSPISNLPSETSGIIDEPELIAVGSNNTSDSASILIEYGYIYESKFQNPQTRSIAIQNLALQTYLGLKNFFETKN